MYAAFVILTVITSVFAASFEDDIFATNGDDPKANYFRYVRTYSEPDYVDLEVVEPSKGLPKPYGFQIYYPEQKRSRREDVTPKEAETTTPSEDELLNIDDSLKPLELDILEDNSTDSSTAASDLPDEMVINDFIRFKRDLKKDSQVETLGTEIDGFRSNRPERSGKMLLSDGQVLDTNREPRGAVQEKWLKQPYSVQVDRTQNRRNFEEGPSNGNLPNAPRVHFVTQRRSDSSPPLVYHSYEGRDREGRSRELTRQRDIDLERDFEPVYYPRPARHYGSQLGGAEVGVRRTEVYRNYERDSRDPRDPRDFRNDRNHYSRDYDRDRRYYQDRYYEENRPEPSIIKNKRIIYYATLPEVIRTPDREREYDRDYDRDRSYRRRFNEDRDVRNRDRDLNRDRDTGRDQSSAINYRFRNESPYDRDRDAQVDKSRYDETETAKSSAYQGTKVSSADVSVRAIKKNPERRVYSDVGRRFPEGYHSEGGAPAFENNHR